MSKASDTSQSVALRVVKVTNVDTDRWEVGKAEMSIHDHVGSYGDAILSLSGWLSTNANIHVIELANDIAVALI